MIDDYTDYSKLRWTISKSPLTAISFLSQRLPLILALLIVFEITASNLSNQQSLIIRSELFWVYSFVGMIIVILVMSIDYAITKSIRAKIDIFKLTRTGIDCNHRHVDYNRLSLKKIIPIANYFFKNITNKPDCLEINLPLKFGRLKLRFPNQITVNKFAISLEKYCTELIANQTKPTSR